MRYTKPQILRTDRAALAIQNSTNKIGVGADSFLQMTAPSYTADE